MVTVCTTCRKTNVLRVACYCAPAVNGIIQVLACVLGQGFSVMPLIYFCESCSSVVISQINGSVNQTPRCLAV